MRHRRTWIAVGALLAGTAASACGGAGECSPTCGPAFECYFGVCVPRSADATDGTGDVPVDVVDAPRDEVGPLDVVDTPHETGTCTGPADCDDHDLCTQDLCDPATGTCHHPVAPDDTPCEDDGNPCTRDVCMGGYCGHPADPDCCTRDADCMWPGHLWECDAASSTCYDPPAGEFCAPCMSRNNCGDGGPDSDDFCATYPYASRGCTKDCLDDLDCPGAATCTYRPDADNRPCEAGDVGCLCMSRLGNCDVLARFGNPCMADAMCRTCAGCDALICPSGYCTWNSEVEQDCVWGATCEGGVCVRAP
jgi:hypothetical protein